MIIFALFKTYFANVGKMYSIELNFFNSNNKSTKIMIMIMIIIIIIIIIIITIIDRKEKKFGSP